MTITRWALVAVVVAGCGGGGRKVEIPDVAVGAQEAGCQQLCGLAGGESICTETHAAFCLAECRARTNGVSAACGACLIAQGTQIAGVTQDTDQYCHTGGAADVQTCATECDDSGAAPSAPDLSVLCDLECTFYMQDPKPLACSDMGSADCETMCAAAVSGHGRVCAQCLIDQTTPSESCLDSDCDCEPFFDSDTTFGCDTLCDTLPPT